MLHQQVIMVLAAVTAAAAAVDLSEEPLLRQLLNDDDTLQLEQMHCCTGSVFGLRKAADAVQGFQHVFNNYLANKDLDKLEQWERLILKFCETKRWPMLLETEDYLLHPINVFKFVAEFVTEVNPQLLQFSKFNLGVKGMLKHLVKNTGCWLGESSITESGYTLLELKLLYNLTVEELAVGQLGGRSPREPLTIQDLHQLLLLLNREMDDTLQVIEFGQFLRKSPQLLQLGEQRIRSLYRILAMALHRTHDSESAQNLLQEYQSQFMSSSSVQADLNFIRNNWQQQQQQQQQLQLQQQRQQQLNEWERKFGLGKDLVKYWRTCDHRDNNLSSSDPLLVCELQRPSNGWIPFRKEILSRSPLVVLYHNAFAKQVFADNELIKEAGRRLIEVVQDSASSNKATFTGATKIRLDAFREAVIGTNSSLVGELIHRIERITGLDALLHARSIEKFVEMTNFGHGLRNGQQVVMHRLFYHSFAVAMFFPSGQYGGGDLLFPANGLRVTPNQSNLIVWFDRKPNFEADDEAGVAFCPILFGDFWTAAVPLGQRYMSVDQELMMENRLPGATLRRRRSLTRPWPKRTDKKLQLEAAAGNGTSSNSSSGNSSSSKLNATVREEAAAAAEKPINVTAAVVADADESSTSP